MKVVPAFLRAEHFADFAYRCEELEKAASSDAPEVGFELGKGLFNRVQVHDMWLETRIGPDAPDARGRYAHRLRPHLWHSRLWPV